MKELVFTVEADEDGGYVAKSRLDNGSIVTQGDTLEELKAMIIDAIQGYYFDKPQERPQTVRLQFEEVFALAS
ncbi:2-oxoisovalerate dehydrogenase E1 subunit beta [Nibrella viscosa]|uniref:2-oxoisovalerate dehydrogenase E1 subunit beta n=1 Tax=Nibrella viscosa TaxID=1084524 RepID=A0ABP8KSZ6_9BACT